MDCSKHKKEVAGISDMKQLAEMIGDLHYETMCDFLSELRKKLHSDSRRDWKNRKVQLSNRLKTASLHIKAAYISINEAWQISKPFMEQK
jgi:hypothetical protein